MYCTCASTVHDPGCPFRSGSAVPTFVPLVSLPVSPSPRYLTDADLEDIVERIARRVVELLRGGTLTIKLPLDTLGTSGVRNHEDQ